MIDDLKRLSALLTPRQRVTIAGLLVGLLVSSILELVGVGSIPVFVGFLSDPERSMAILSLLLPIRLIENVKTNDLVLYGAVALAVLFLVKNVFLTWLLFATERVVSLSITAVSTRLFQAYLYSPYTFHLHRNPANLIRNTTYDPSQALGLILSALILVRESLVLLVFFALLLVTDPLVSVLVFMMLGLAATVFYVVVRDRLTHRGRLSQIHREAQTRAVNQGLGAIKDAKILGREQYVLAVFKREVHGFHMHQSFQRVISQMPKPFLEVLAIFAVLMVTVAFVLLGRPLEEMLPVLALLAVAVVRMVPAFNGITSALSVIRYQRPSLELVYSELLQFEQVPQSNSLANRATHVGDSSTRPLRRAIHLEHIDYVYPHSHQKVLSNVSLIIRAGEAVALIGSSGAGKSTLVDVILGLLTPVAGRVMIDDWDLQDNPSSWQRQIGYIPQDIYLLDDCIRRNIAFGLDDTDIDERAVQAALVAAQLDDFVASLPEGLGTVIGNRGIRLSGGQRQRVGIARALYHNPRVLVMDEATSALDGETEREVIAAINRLRGERTIVMVAHRLTTVRSCDRLYLLDGGKIVDSGSYDELSNRHRELQLTTQAVAVVD